MQIGLKLHILRLEDCFRTPLGFRSEFAATQHRLSLFEISIAARELCRQALVIGHRGFHLLLRRRMSLIQTFLALALGVGANQVRTYCLPTSFSCRDLCLCLIDTGKRFGYTRVLQLALAQVVFDGGMGCLNCRTGLVSLCLVVVVLQFHNELPFVYSLKVGYVDRAHDAGHLGARRRKITADVRVISYLFDVPAFPTIPVASDGDENCQGERHNKEGSHVLFPSHPARRSVRRLFALWRQRLRHGGGGVSRYWRGGHHICSFSKKKSASAALLVIIPA